MKPSLCVLLVSFGMAHAPCQILTSTDTPDPSLQQTTGSKLKHFSLVDDGVYKGSRPKSDADYRFLQSLKIKYIVNLHVFPLLGLSEKRKAKKYGITVITGKMNASPISPSEKHVNEILAVLRNAKYHPVYFHCKFGRDRSVVIAALYKMYFLGMTPKEAEQYLRQSGYGFKYGWLRSGLTRYLKNHPIPSPDLISNLNAAASDRPTETNGRRIRGVGRNQNRAVSSGLFGE